MPDPTAGYEYLLDMKGLECSKGQSKTTWIKRREEVCEDYINKFKSLKGHSQMTSYDTSPHFFISFSFLPFSPQISIFIHRRSNKRGRSNSSKIWST